MAFFVDPTLHSRGGLFTSYMRFRLKGHAIFNGSCSSISVASIICQSMQMFRFLSSSQKVEHSKGGGTITIAHTFNVSSTNQIAEFTLEKEKYSLSPGWLANDDVTLRLRLECKNKISLFLLCRLAHNVTNLAQWLFFRTDFFLRLFYIACPREPKSGRIVFKY